MNSNATFIAVCISGALTVGGISLSRPDNLVSPAPIQTRLFGLNPEALGEMLGSLPTSPGTIAVTSPLTVDETTFPPHIVTSIQYPGDAVVAVRGQCAVICGAKDLVPGVSLNGVVSIVAVDANGVFVKIGSEYVESGSNFVGAAYCVATSELFLLDSHKKRIVKASYTPGNAPPTSWTTVVTEAQFAPLAGMANYSLSIDVDSTTPVLEVAPWRAYVSPPELDNPCIYGDAYLVTLAASGPTYATHPSYRDKQVMMTRIEGEDLRDGATSISVRGVPGESVNIVRVDGLPTIEGSGVIGPDGSAQIAVSAVVMGGVYVARHSAKTEDSPPYFIPIRRFGSSDSLTDGLSLTQFSDAHAHESFVNNPRFNLTMAVQVVQPSQVVIDKTYSAALIVGSESDIVVVNGKEELLGPYVFWTDFTSTEVSSSAMIAVDIPIPDMPSLAGTSHCYQFLVLLEGGVVRSSDILCMSVRADEYMPPGAAAFFPPPGATALRSPTRAKKVAKSSRSMIAVRDWMSASGAESVHTSKKAKSLRQMRLSQKRRK